eukprot:UN01720
MHTKPTICCILFRSRHIHTYKHLRAYLLITLPTSSTHQLTFPILFRKINLF